MRLALLALAVILSTLASGMPAQAATTYTFDCPPAPADDGTTHWTGGGNRVNATPVSDSPGTWSVSCNYSGSSLDGQLRIYRPGVGATFKDESATTTHIACYRPGRTLSGTHYSSSTQASAHRNADALYAALDGARESLLSQAEAFAAPCPVVRCPYESDGDRLLSDVIDRASFGRRLLSCYYRPAEGSGPAIVFSLSWLNVTAAATAASSSYIACTGRSLPENNVTREGFEVYASWRWESTATTAALPASARSFAASLFPIAADAAECPGPGPSTAPTATPAPGTAVPTVATPTPSPGEPRPFPCPARWDHLGGASPVFRSGGEVRPDAAHPESLVTATCIYGPLPHEDATAQAGAERAIEITWVPLGNSGTDAVCRAKIDSSLITSGTYLASVRMGGSTPPDGDHLAFARFALGQLLPVAEGRAEPCPFGSGADQLADAPCGSGYEMQGRRDYALVREPQLFRWASRGAEGFLCEFEAPSEGGGKSPLLFNLTWQLEGTSVPHWSCTKNATLVEPMVGLSNAYRHDDRPGIGVVVGHTGAQVPDEGEAIAIRLLRFFRHHAAPCENAELTGGLLRTPSPAPSLDALAVGSILAGVALVLRRRSNRS